MQKTVILIPTYNERENIALLIPEIFFAHPELFVLVIDDNSPDGTATVVHNLQEKYPHLSLLSRPLKQGLGVAYKAGMGEVLSDPEVRKVITMDADGSHAVEYLSLLLEKSAHYDLVIGSRYVKGGGIESWEKWRYMLSSWGNRYSRSITLLPVYDLTAGFMCFNADLLRQMDLSRIGASGYAFLMELKFNAIVELKARVVEVPIIFMSRREGESKISRHIIREGLKTPWRLLWKRVASTQKSVQKIKELPLCPLCGSATVVFGNKNEYILYRCTRCALVCVHPTPALARLYSAEYFSGAKDGFGYTDYDADKEPMVPTFQSYIQKIRKFVREGGRLLDVGAATGFFLSLAERAGFTVEGVEISSYAANRAREKGIGMTLGTLTDVPLAKKFEVITMFDVIEHVPDPQADIVRAHTLLAENGILVINTPDIGSWYARLLGIRWHLVVPPEHLFYFNRENISTLLRTRGFEVLSIETIGKHFTLQYIFKTLYAWQGFRIWKRLEDFCARNIPHLSLPINLRDNMFVLARKIK